MLKCVRKDRDKNRKTSKWLSEICFSALFGPLILAFFSYFHSDFVYETNDSHLFFRALRYLFWFATHQKQ